MTIGEDATRRAYDVVADTYADAFPSTEPEAELDLAVIRHFARLLPPGAAVVDGGCGAGRMLPLLTSMGLTATGLDLSPEMVRRARTDHPWHEIHVGSLTAMPIADGAFDGAFYWYSTIHSSDEDLAVIFAEARRILRPGGYLLTAFQVGESVREVGQRFRRRGHDVELMRHHRSPEAVAAAAAREGFQLVTSMTRAALPPEADAQAVLILRRG